MDPKDDPEARIRELEQASGAQRARELGVGESGASYSYAPPPQPSSYPPPPPPSGYVPPSEPNSYPPPPSQPWSGLPPPSAPTPFPAAPGYFGPSWGKTKRSASRRLVFIPIVFALVAFGPSLFSFVTNGLFHSGNGSGGSSHTFGSGGSTTASPSPTTPPAGSIETLAGINETKTAICNDSQLTVGGFSNTVTITGHCSTLTVAGNDNVVVVDSADSITAAGSRNKVTYHSGTPIITNPLGDSVIERG